MQSKFWIGDVNACVIFKEYKRCLIMGWYDHVLGKTEGIVKNVLKIEFQ